MDRNTGLAAGPGPLRIWAGSTSTHTVQSAAGLRRRGCGGGLEHKRGGGEGPGGLRRAPSAWIVTNVDNEHFVADGARSKYVDGFPSICRAEQVSTAARTAARVAL